jgi:hypothetical protein
VRVQQPETGAVVESAIKIGVLDTEFKTVEELEELREDIAGVSPATSWRTTCCVPARRELHTRGTPVPNFACEKYSASVSALSPYRDPPAIVSTDLRRSIRDYLKRISLKERVSNCLNGVKFELIGEISLESVGVR